VVLGVNQDHYDPDSHHIISNASCTTNCLAPVVKVLLDSFGFRTRRHDHGPRLHERPERSSTCPTRTCGRARAAAMSIIPTTTGAAKATGLVIPEVQGKLDGMAMRVPTPDVSIVDLVAELGRDVTVEEVNGAMRAAAAGDLNGILEVSDEELVSVDYTGHPASSIVDCQVHHGHRGRRLVKVVSWYDNEWGYSTRCVDLAVYIGATDVAATKSIFEDVSLLT
jgi:glyceraldehyde 3-phosphate dehydrogenase